MNKISEIAVIVAGIDEEYQQHEDFYIVLANRIADILKPGIEAWYFLYVRLQWLCVSSLS